MDTAEDYEGVPQQRPPAAGTSFVAPVPVI
jgi:hypothetical protein